MLNNFFKKNILYYFRRLNTYITNNNPIKFEISFIKILELLFISIKYLNPGKIQTRKRLTMISKHYEARKGVVIDEMFRLLKNKHRFENFRIGQSFKLLPNSFIKFFRFKF